MGKPGSALQPGKRIELGDGVGDRDRSRCCRTATAWSASSAPRAEEAIARFGRLPLPPYITRDPTDADEDRYQTVYARAEGSVAAPTAGLHFTPAILDALSAKGVLIAGLDLQVGPGTFKPVEVDDPARAPDAPGALRDQPAGSRRWSELVREQGGRIWAVGTTVVRALESAADESGAVQAGRGRDPAHDHARATTSAWWTACSPTSTCPARPC